MRVDSTSPRSRLSGYAASTLWHRRLIRTGSSSFSKVQPRVSAELVLHPVTRDASVASPVENRRPAARHAA
jgi:hypothetical protein